MEGLKLRAFVVAGVLLAMGAIVGLSAQPVSAGGKSEDWMKEQALTKVGAYRMETSHDDPGVTYRMPQSTYDVLVPYGIVARVFRHENQSYDVVLIASRDRRSFHDPRVCFSAQNYQIESEETIEIPTKTRGTIPATLAKMKGPNGPTVAVFFYRGPHGFHASTMGLKWALLFDQLKGKSDLDGVFYRIIPSGDLSTDKLVRFIGMYMDESGRHSKGYF